MEKQTYSIQIQSIEGSYQALVPQLEVTAIGSTVDEAISNIIAALSRTGGRALNKANARKAQKESSVTLLTRSGTSSSQLVF